jgi:hypothetical protein
MKLKKTNFLLFLSKCKHWCILPYLRFFALQLSLLSSCLCIYIAGVCWNRRMHYYPFLDHLEPIMVESSLVVLCLEDRTPIEVGWQVPLVRFNPFIHWFVIGIWEYDYLIEWFNMRLSGQTRGIWRIPDGKVGERSVFMFGASRW